MYDIGHSMVQYAVSSCMLICSQLCDEIDEHEKNSPDMIEEEKKKIPGDTLLLV